MHSKPITSSKLILKVLLTGPEVPPGQKTKTNTHTKKPKIRSVIDEIAADFSKSGTVVLILNLLEGKEAFKSAGIREGPLHGFVKGDLTLEIEIA